MPTMRYGLPFPREVPGGCLDGEMATCKKAGTPNTHTHLYKHTHIHTH